MVFILKNRQDDMVAQIAIPLPNAYEEAITPKDYQVQEVILGKPSKDIAKALMTLSLKQVLQ